MGEAEGKLNGGRRPAFGAGFLLAPVVDGKVFPAHPFDQGAPEMSKGIPLLIGTVMNESSLSAFHCSELAFVFDNTDRCTHMTGGGADARELGGKVNDAWIHFAKTGNPNHPGLPNWPAVAASNVPTMVFNTKCEMLHDHDREARKMVAQAKGTRRESAARSGGGLE